MRLFHRTSLAPAEVITAADAFFAEHRAKVIAREAEREQWRRDREASPERRKMRHELLARARAAKRQ